MITGYNLPTTCVIRTLLDYINSFSFLPTVCNLEYLNKETPSFMLMQLSGLKRVNHDILGGYSVELPFALCLRVDGSGQTVRFEAVRLFELISAKFEKDEKSGGFPDLGGDSFIRSISVTHSTSLISRNDDGTEDYQAVFMLEYIKRV